MDLRPFNPTPAQAETARRLLDYQPFVIDDDHCTGIAYSWLHATDPTRAGFDWDSSRFSRTRLPADVWQKAWAANRQLAATYDRFIDVIAERFPGASFLDVSCNNGYFPVQARLKGMGDCAGLDPLDRSQSLALLNAICGTDAKYIRGGYVFGSNMMAEHVDPRADRDDATSVLVAGQHVAAIPMLDQFDVVTNSAFMCHVGEPLHFLGALAGITRHALLVYNGFVETDEYLIRFNPPRSFIQGQFPACYNDGTALSVGLLKESMRQLGFPKITAIESPPNGLASDWHLARMAKFGKWFAFLCER